MSYFKLFDNSSSLSNQNPLPQWIALFFGVLAQPFFAYFQKNGNIDWAMAYSNWAFLLFSVIIAVVIFPAVYKSTFDADRPKIIQIIPIFTAGLGWETCLDSAFKGATTAATAGSGTSTLIDGFNQQILLYF